MTLIEIESVSKVYDLGEVQVRALDDVSLPSNTGNSCPSWVRQVSGKSTLMNILGCLDQPSDGRYFLEGVDVAYGQGQTGGIGTRR